ncbi:MAG: sulfatase-like hydrolase/transferase [Candidatus Marinimicrobia bacterium]|nr:sulfatase-like hydrolase/transferase [Candidatus Neomarinimicrobiota bacterium]
MGVGKLFHGHAPEGAFEESGGRESGFGPKPPKRLKWEADKTSTDWGPFPETDAEMPDFRTAQWAVERLEQEHEKPFFLAAGLYRPHLPWYAPEKYFEKFPEAETILPEILEGDLDDIPPSALRSLRDHAEVTGSGQWKRAVATYLACIHYADQNVGRILKSLDEGPNADNTTICLWTDHGWHLGEKQHWRKFTLWEESCGVPLIVAGKGVSAQGAVCERTVELLGARELKRYRGGHYTRISR